MLIKLEEKSIRNIILHYKMRQMLQCPQFSFLLRLVTIIGIGIFTVGVGKNKKMKQSMLMTNEDTIDQQLIQFIVHSGPTQLEDMDKAMEIGKTYFWQKLIERWDCERSSLEINAEEMKISKEKITEICENWQMKGLAADAYVKSWECKKEEKQKVDCICVQPRFMLVNQGELLMSSAMEMIKGMYGKLFHMGSKEELKIDINFMNEKAWDIVDRWVKSLKSRDELDDMNDEEAEILCMLLQLEADNKDILSKAKDALDNDPYFDRFEHSEFSKQFLNAPPRFESSYALRKNALDREKKTLTQSFYDSFDILSQEFEEQLQLFMQEKNSHEKLKIAKRLHERNVKKLWGRVQQIALSWSSLCEAGKEHVTKLEEEKKHSYLMKTIKKTLNPLLFANQPIELDAKLGSVFINYKNKIQVPMMEKHPKEMEQLLVMDPCEEAKLKVWAKKEEKTDKDSH